MKNNITAVILSGGKSSRMGEDKGLILIDGKSMVQHQIDVLEQVGLNTVIISNNDAYDQFDKPVFRDTHKEIGPLGGLHSAFENTDSNRILTLSCDTPFVSKDLILALINQNSDDDIIISKHGNKKHPLIGIYSKNILPLIVDNITNNEFKIMNLLSQVKTKTVDFTDRFTEDEFRNLNSKEDIETNVELRLYGLIAERLNNSSLEVTIPNTSTTNLRNHFNEKWPFLNDISYKIAVDQELRDTLNKNEQPKEIAILPPFAGG